MDSLEDLYKNDPLDKVVDDLDDIISKIDKINETFERTEKALEKSIAKTQENKQKIDSFILKIEGVSSELGVVSDEVGSTRFTLNFKEVFPISDSLIFLAFPLLVSLIITFTSLVLSNMFILKQINAPSYLRDIITPTGDVSFLIADYLINLFFVSVQASVLFSLGYLWFGVSLDILLYYVLAVFLPLQFLFLLAWL